MSFSATGITAHPDMGTIDDYVLDAAWHPNGDMWAFINRGAGGGGGHFLSVYHPTSNTWETRLLIVSDGAAATDPQSYSYQNARCAINKNGVCLFLYATGGSGAGRTYYRIIQEDYTIGAANELTSFVGGHVDGSNNGGAIGASIINDCTDFAVVFKDNLGHGNLSAIEINSVTAALSNRREIWDYSAIPAGDNIGLYRHCSDVNPVDNTVCALAEWTETTQDPQTRHVVYVQEGGTAHVFTSAYHLAHNLGPPARFYSMRPEFVCDNITADKAHVIFQVNSIGVGSAGTTGTVYVPITDESFGTESLLSDVTPLTGTDQRSICIDGNGNVYLGFANSTPLEYTDATSYPTPDGIGMQCLQINSGTSVTVDRHVIGRYSESEEIDAFFPRMRPTTQTLMCLWRTPATGTAYNVDPAPPGFVTEAEVAHGFGECAGMLLSEGDMDHQVYVFDERSYSQDDGSPLA